MQTTNIKGKQPLHNRNRRGYLLVAVMLLGFVPATSIYGSDGNGVTGSSQSISSQKDKTDSFWDDLKRRLNAWLAESPNSERDSNLAAETTTNSITVPLLEASENRLIEGTYSLHLGWWARGKTSIKEVNVRCGTNSVVSQKVVDNEKHEVVLPNRKFAATETCKVDFNPVPVVSGSTGLSFKVVPKTDFPSRCKDTEKELLAACLLEQGPGWELEVYQKVASASSGNETKVKNLLRTGVPLPLNKPK